MPAASRPVSAVLIGAGSRGMLYARYALAMPESLRIVAVAEPSPARRELIALEHGLAPERCAADWESLLNGPKLADAVLICTPDHLHFAPCMAALAAGYDVLLEKPIAPTEAECRMLLARAHETGRIVAVCHVLRYAPYFEQLHTLLHSGAIGKVLSVQHFEPIEFAHMAHSFVRGAWRNSTQSAPIILAKCSHDLDLLRWLVGARADQVQAFGEQSWFTLSNAPEGSTDRCTDGCEVESTCPYSARRIYLEERQRLYAFDLAADEPQRTTDLVHALATSSYGRCVYRLDNDQCDHYVANIRFENGVTASFTMAAFTPWQGRRTRVMGSNGYLEGDMERLVLHDFASGAQSVWESEPEIAQPDDSTIGHGGGDQRLLADFVRAVRTQDVSALSATLDEAIDSHLMAFAAERSRLGGTVERMRY